MNTQEINYEIDKLDLAWQEYDFGDILCAKISIDSLVAKTRIEGNCQTDKYEICFQNDGFALVLRENPQVSSVTKIVKILRLLIPKFLRHKLTLQDRNDRQYSVDKNSSF